MIKDGRWRAASHRAADSANSTRLSKVPCGNLRHKIFRTHAANLRADYTSHGPCMHAQRSSINEDVWFLIFAANCPFWRLRQGREAAGERAHADSGAKCRVFRCGWSRIPVRRTERPARTPARRCVPPSATHHRWRRRARRSHSSISGCGPHRSE